MMRREFLEKSLKVIVVFAVVASLLCLAGCTGETNGYKIGITQIADHPSLDNCREGFIEGLKQEGIVDGENADIDFQSAQNDITMAGQIAQNFSSVGKDLVCGIATPSAQALYTACYEKGIPVVFNAVSDPVEARLAESAGVSYDGITGVSDALPVEDQLKLIRDILPDAKKIGILYTTSESNSVSTLRKYKELSGKYGFEIVEKGIGTQAEVAQATDILLNQVDCISNMTDNTVVAALSVVLEKANAKKIPVFGSEVEQVVNGCIASAGLDYFALGVKAGKMAARILGGENISDIPYETLDESEISVNEKVAESLGINIPQSVKDIAEIVK
jgi:putative ABC transport system substrate-binding protein